jgi:hypothetical protein
MQQDNSCALSGIGVADIDVFVEDVLFQVLGFKLFFRTCNCERSAT